MTAMRNNKRPAYFSSVQPVLIHPSKKISTGITVQMQDSRCGDAMGAGTLSTQQQSKQQEQKVHGNKKSD
jgi:hypothetical protein